jgi:hypothetical protein
MLQFRAIHSDESSRASLLKLVQARTQVEQTAHLVRWARARVCETGVWSADLDQHAEQLAQAVARWDQQMALLLRDHLLGGEFELLLDQFSGLQRLGTEGSCDRCRAPLYHEIHQAPLDGLPPYHRLTCLVCGLREAWREDGVRLALALPERFVPGETLALHFSSSGPRCTAAGAQLVLLATDKGRGAPFARVALPCPDGQPLIVQLALPETLTPDLHTTVVAWVGGLDVAFFRFRTLGRATSAPAAG